VHVGIRSALFHVEQASQQRLVKHLQHPNAGLRTTETTQRRLNEKRGHTDNTRDTTKLITHQLRENADKDKL